MHGSVRQRQNRSSTASELLVLEDADRAAISVPELPSDRLWDPKTSEFWQAAWQSPMRLQWDPADHHKLLMAAYLLDEFYAVAGETEMKRLDRAYALNKLAKSVLDLTARMGIDPFARRSLQWMLVQTERDEADRDLKKAKTAQTRAATPPAKPRRGKEYRALE